MQRPERVVYLGVGGIISSVLDYYSIEIFQINHFVLLASISIILIFSIFKKGKIADTGNTGWNRDALKTGASIEGIVPDTGDTIRNDDALKAGAIPEGSEPDTGDTLRNSNTHQASATIECVIANTGHPVRNRDAR